MTSGSSTKRRRGGNRRSPQRAAEALRADIRARSKRRERQTLSRRSHRSPGPGRSLLGSLLSRCLALLPTFGKHPPPQKFATPAPRNLRLELRQADLLADSPTNSSFPGEAPPDEREDPCHPAFVAPLADEPANWPHRWDPCPNCYGRDYLASDCPQCQARAPAPAAPPP